MTLRSKALLALPLLFSCAGGDPRDPPPYPVFDGIPFEPSAVAYDPPSDRYIVFSDKDFICYRFALRDGRLALGRGERHRELALPGGKAALKLEALTRLEGGRFLALTAFDRDDEDFRRLVRFRFAPSGPVPGEELEFPAEAIGARLRLRDPGLRWWKVEGLAALEGDRAILVAVRSVGNGAGAERDVVWIVRLPGTERGYGPPDRFVELDALRTLGRGEGASSIERDPSDGSYYLLTSWESGEARREDHGGHLFRLPRALFEGAGRDPAPAPLPPPLRSFAAKPEGLAVTPEGRVLVVFDDDGAYKDLSRGYARSQGLFLVLERAELEAPARGGGR